MDEHDLDWLGDLRWRGYPNIQPALDVASAPPKDGPRPASKGGLGSDPRVIDLARENESLRARLEQLSRLAPEFERRLSEAASAYEGTMLESESRLRDAALELERRAGELDAAKAEGARLAARDAARETELRVERERRADAEKIILEARRKIEELTAQADHLRESAAEHAGTLAELRRQASAQSDRLIQSKALTDQDVRLLRQEMRDFLAKIHRIQGSSGETP